MPHCFFHYSILDDAHYLLDNAKSFLCEIVSRKIHTCRTNQSLSKHLDGLPSASNHLLPLRMSKASTTHNLAHTNSINIKENYIHQNTFSYLSRTIIFNTIFLQCFNFVLQCLCFQFCTGFIPRPLYKPQDLEEWKVAYNLDSSIHTLWFASHV